MLWTCSFCSGCQDPWFSGDGYGHSVMEGNARIVTADEKRSRNSHQRQERRTYRCTKKSYVGLVRWINWLKASPSEAKGIKLGATTEYSSTIILLKRYPLKNKAYLFIFVFFQSIRTSFSSCQYQFVPSSNQVIHTRFNPYQFQFVLSLCQIIRPDKSSTQFVVL